MLKIGKIRGVNTFILYVREKERLLQTPFIIALSLAILYHLSLWILFRVHVFYTDSDYIFPSIDLTLFSTVQDSSPTATHETDEMPFSIDDLNVFYKNEIGEDIFRYFPVDDVKFNLMSDQQVVDHFFKHAQLAFKEKKWKFSIKVASETIISNLSEILESGQKKIETTPIPNDLKNIFGYEFIYLVGVDSSSNRLMSWRLTEVLESTQVDLDKRVFKAICESCLENMQLTIPPSRSQIHTEGYFQTTIIFQFLL